MRKRTRLPPMWPGFNSKRNTVSGLSILVSTRPVARFSFRITEQDLTFLDLLRYLSLFPVSPINRAFALV